MNLGIVGHEARKFTPRTKILASVEIRVLFEQYQPDLVISGHSPLGGIDWWAVQLAKLCGIETLEYPAAIPTWKGVKGMDGFEARNLKIARNSDVVACIVVKQLPESFRGQRFEYCYHCKTDEHIKSGGCWTMKQAAALGKQTQLVVIQ